MQHRIKTEKLKSLLTSPFVLLQYYNSTQMAIIQGKVVVLSPNKRTENKTHSNYIDFLKYNNIIKDMN